jgi:hypothetical protein
MAKSELDTIEMVRSKLIVIYTFDPFDIVSNDVFSLNLEMLKLSIASVLRELGAVTINVYTSNGDQMTSLLSELKVNVIEVNRSQYICDDVDLSMSEKYQKFTTFIGHVRLFIIEELLNAGHSVLYLDNDTGCIHSKGNNILNKFTHHTSPMGYCKEAQTLKSWLKDTNCRELEETPRIAMSQEFIDSNDLQGISDQRVINCGVMYFPCNELSISISKAIINNYHLLIEKFKFSFGHDQAAVFIGFSQHSACMNEVMCDDVNLCAFVHYYREKYKYNDKCAQVLLMERRQLRIKWHDIINDCIDEQVSLPMNTMDTYKHSLFNIFNIERQSELTFNKNYLFYPHLDLFSDTFDSTVCGTKNYNTNGFTRDSMNYELLFKRFESSSSGLYVIKPHSKIVNTKIIHQICIDNYAKNAGVMEEYSRIWRIMNPTWEYRLWMDKDITDSLLGRYKELYQSIKEPRIKAKILTYIILYEHGGIYFDLDCRPLKPLDDELLSHETFAAFVNEYYFASQIAHNVFGSIKENFILLGLLEKARENDSTLSMSALNEYLNMGQEIFVYPSYYFYPEHHYGYRCDSTLRKYSYCVHEWIGQRNKFKLDDNEYLLRIGEIEHELSDEELTDAVFDVKMIELIDNVSKSNLDIERKVFYYLTFYTRDATRYDMLYRVGKLYREDENYNLAYVYLHNAYDYLIKHSMGTNDMFNMPDLYRIPSRIKDFDIFDELALVCYHKGLDYYIEGADALDQLVRRSSISINKILLDKHANRLKQNAKMINHALVI